MLVDAIFKVYAILTLADAILTHLAKVKIRFRLMVDCLKLKGMENNPFHSYAVTHSLIK